jgi:hypothetical protein
MFTERSLELDFILNISGAFLSKIIRRISPRTVERFPVLLAPNSKSTYKVIIKLLPHTLYILCLQELGPEVIKVFILPHISSLAQKIDIGTHPLTPHILHSLQSTQDTPTKELDLCWNFRTIYGGLGTE